MIFKLTVIHMWLLCFRSLQSLSPAVIKRAGCIITQLGSAYEY